MPGITYVGNRDCNNRQGSKFLNYDGHPGYDYAAPIGTKVFAAVAGTIKYPKRIVGADGNQNHVHAQVPDGDGSYRVYYLHLSTYPNAQVSYPTNIPQAGCYKNPSGKSVVLTQLPPPEGTWVNSGCLIGLSGDAGVKGRPHLHVEVQRIYPADQIAISISQLNCWQELTWNDKNKPGRDAAHVCLPLDPYGWTGKATACNDPDQNKIRDTYACLTGIPSQRLWDASAGPAQFHQSDAR